jgi:hypothetical protein
MKHIFSNARLNHISEVAEKRAPNFSSVLWFIRGAIWADQTFTDDSTIEAWVARDNISQAHDLYLFPSKPRKVMVTDTGEFYFESDDKLQRHLLLEKDDFPEVTPDMSPRRVKITLCE